jgi:D-beta-D-heptose 7-phosphate kinase/D-beta-D-heptose 1-phosphate adenosyltransferase
MSPYHDISKDAMRSLFNDFSSLHLLIAGDLILDHYIWGSVDRISPEAPVPVINVDKKESRLGGAGNVAANLAGLGMKVTLAGICGNDGYQDILLELCHQKQILPFLRKIDNRRTTVKSRIIAQHQQLVRIDEENREPVPIDISNRLLKDIRQNAGGFDGVILSDYRKGLLTDELIAEILKIFPDKPVIIDPKGYDYKKYHGATAIKPNRKEFTHAVQHLEMKDNEIEKYAQKLVEDLNLKGIVITLGKDGVFILDENRESLVIPTKAREVYDVSGAGDTFIAAFTAGLIISNDWFTAAKAANLASGVVVGKIGTATVTADEIIDSYNL